MSPQYPPEFLEKIRTLFVPGQEYAEEEIVRRVVEASGGKFVNANMAIQAAVGLVISEAFPRDSFEVAWNQKQIGVQQLTDGERGFMLSRRSNAHDLLQDIPVYATTMVVKALQKQ